MSDPIRESVARAIDPQAFADIDGYEYYRRRALEAADKVIAAHLSALEAQGYVVVRKERPGARSGGAPYIGGAAVDVTFAASNKETGL